MANNDNANELITSSTPQLQNPNQVVFTKEELEAKVEENSDTETEDDGLTDEQLLVSDFLEKLVGKDYNKIKTKLMNRLSKLGKVAADYSARKNIVILPLVFPDPNSGIKRFRDETGSSSAPYVDADLAIDQLQKYNTMNRPITPHEVYKLAIAMITGEYDEHNPDGIYYCVDRTLLNGQKRYLATVAASLIIPDIKIRFPMEFNHEKKLMRVIDIPEKRTLAHVAVMEMKRKGITFENQLYQGVTASQLMELVNGMHMGKILDDDTKVEILDLNKDLFVKFFNVLRKNKSNLRYNASWAACFVKAALPEFFGEKVIFPIAERFAQQKFSGDGDPLRELHNRLARATKENITPKLRYGLVLKAIRKVLLEEKVVNLHSTTYDWTVEEAKDYLVKSKNSSLLRAASRLNAPPSNKPKKKAKNIPLAGRLTPAQLENFVVSLLERRGIQN